MCVIKRYDQILKYLSVVFMLHSCMYRFELLQQVENSLQEADTFLDYFSILTHI